MFTFNNFKKKLAAVLLVFILPLISLAESRGDDPISILRKMQLLKQTITSGIQAENALKNKAKNQFFKVQSDGSITGIISGLPENKISSGFVMAWVAKNDSSPGNFGYASINKNGGYEINGLKSGSFIVYIQVEGFIPQFFPGVTNADSAEEVTVIDGQPTQGIGFSLSKYNSGSGSITGTIKNKQTGFPISGAIIVAWSGKSDSIVTTFSPSYAWTLSDENGKYELTELGEGKYFISSWANGYVKDLYFSGLTVEVLNETVTENINFLLSKSASFSGTVSTSSGEPIKWAFVSGYSDNVKNDSSMIYKGNYSVTYSDENGNYELTNISGGDFYLSAQTYTGWESITEWYNESPNFEGADKITISDGEAISGINFTLDLPDYTGSVSGKVIDKYGNGISYASVIIYSAILSDSISVPVSKNYYFNTSTDSDGKYTLSKIPDGKFYVKTYSYNNWKYSEFWYPSASSESGAEIVVLENGSQVSNINIETQLKNSSSSVSGKVTDKNGNPIQSAYVFLSSFSSGKSGDSSGYVWANAITDSLGNYSIAKLEEGKYLLYAYYSNGDKFSTIWYNQSETAEGATQVSVSENQNITDINFILNPKSVYGNLTGMVKDNSGKVIEGAYVEITPFWESKDGSDRYFGKWKMVTNTSSDGSFNLSWIYAGDYTVAVYADGGSVFYPDGVIPQLSKPLTITADSTTNIELTVEIRSEGSGSIEGILTSDVPTFEPIDGVVTAKPTVTILSYPQSEMFYTTVSKDGMYKLKNLPDGEYYLYAFSGQLLGEFYDDVYDPSKAKIIEVYGGETLTGINFSLADYFTGGESDSSVSVTNARVFGKVTDVEGNILAEVNVNLISSEGKVVSSSKTNAKGYYEISGIPSGQYTLKPAKVGMESVDNKNELLMMNKNNIEHNLVLKVTGSTVNVNDRNKIQPTSLELIGVYPNPFNPETAILFNLSSQSPVRISIYNLLGQQIREMSFSNLNLGENQIRWNGKTDDGIFTSSSLYLFRITAGNKSISGKMILSK